MNDEEKAQLHRCRSEAESYRQRVDALEEELGRVTARALRAEEELREMRKELDLMVRTAAQRTA